MPDKKSPVQQEEIPAATAAPEAVVPSAPETEVAPLHAEIPAALPTAIPPAAQPQVVYLKKPFYKLAWFWIAAGLAVVCFCFVVGGIGFLIGRGGEGRMSRSIMMQDNYNMRMEDGRGMQYYNGGQGGQAPRDPGSLETTPTTVPNGQQRLQKNGSGSPSGRDSGSSGSGGQIYVTPGPRGQMMVTPGN